jgi:putative transposase
MSVEADSALHHRRSLRLKEYDYSQEGAYFITICTQNRECTFGDVLDWEMVLNDSGRVVTEEWVKSADIRSEIELDAFVVMPNHIHGIVWIRRGDRPVAPTSEPIPVSGPKPKSIGSFIAGFKSACTKHINDMRNARGTPVWQRNYYEHVIRDEDDLNRIRQYIHDNPARWVEDENNPERMK